MNYSTLQSTVLARLNMSTSDPAAASIASDVNEAIHFIETLAPDGWSWTRGTYTFTTTANTASYTMSQISSSDSINTVLDVQILRQSNYWQRLDLINPHEAELTYPQTNTGIPQAYFVDGTTLYIYPTPDAAYQTKVRATKYEPDLTGGGSSPVMPTVYHSAIVEATLTIVYERLQDTTRLGLAQSRLDQWLQRMRVSQSKYQGAPRITVREWL